jgi:hypothetical protein
MPKELLYYRWKDDTFVIIGQTVYLLDVRKEFRMIDPDTGITNLGHNMQPKLDKLDPSTAFVYAELDDTGSFYDLIVGDASVRYKWSGGRYAWTLVEERKLEDDDKR